MLYIPQNPAARQASSSSVPDFGPSLQESKSKSHSAMSALLLVFQMKSVYAKVISPYCHGTIPKSKLE